MATSPRRPTRRRRHSRWGSGWATATAPPMTASCRSTRPPRFGRPSCPRSARARRSPSSSPRRRASSGAKVDVYTGLRPGSVHDPDHHRILPAGNRPEPEGERPRRGHRRQRQRPEVARWLRRAEGHAWLLQPLRGRVELPELAEGERQLGRSRGTWIGRRRRTEGHADLVLLQRGIRAIRTDLGRALRPDQALSALHPAATGVRPIREPRPRDADRHLRARRWRPEAAGRDAQAQADQEALRLGGPALRTRRSSRRPRLRRAARGGST